MSASTLTPEQTHALFDILTHYQIYSEIENFKWPEGIKNYGYPFSKDENGESSAPILQMMFNSFIVKLPTIKDLPAEFWQEKLETLVANFGKAELSESYDKGSMGTRKTLSTASSVLLELVARGCLGGCPRSAEKSENEEYDKTRADDLKKAWNKAADEMVYGDFIDELYKSTAETDNMAEKPSLIQAAVEHVILFSASLTHHLFVLSPDGQYLLRLLSNANKLIPYMAIKQTLRVGNAATMINGMIRLILTKLSVTAFTNWIGLSKNTDEGMNLLQQIISTILTWDNSDFKDHATKIEKSKDGPSREHLDAIESHFQTSREEREEIRKMSIAQSKSIVITIFETAAYPPSTELSEAQHAQALEFYSAKLSMRDRKEIINVLCKQYPDGFTEAIRQVVSAYDPLIRSIHNGVDLTAGMGDLQNFIEDMIKTVNPKAKIGGGNTPPSVEDFVALFRKHFPSMMRFLHQVAKNCPEVSETFRGYCNDAIRNFRAKEGGVDGAAGGMTSALEMIFGTLPEGQKGYVLEALDAHARYLASLASLSNQRAQAVLDNKSTTMYGPGAYLARWHGLLDETLITPANPEGPIRKGKDIKFQIEKGKEKGKSKGLWDSAEVGQKIVGEMPEQPDVSVVVKLLGKGFVDILRKEIGSEK